MDAQYNTNSQYINNTEGDTMRTIIVKLEDELAEALEHLDQEEGFASKSELGT